MIGRHLIALALLTLLASDGCAVVPTDERGVERIESTSGIGTTDLFSFTISPDDRWIIFFRRVDVEEKDRHHNFGNLRILDLTTGAIHSETIGENSLPRIIRGGDSSWAPDSSHCLLPPPQTRLRQQVDSGVLINVREPAAIKVTRVQVKHGEVAEVIAPDDEYRAPGYYTCSDCFPNTDNVELIKKHVDERYLHFHGTNSLTPNKGAAQVVSPDGKKIYYQKGPERPQEQRDSATLYELDIASGQERELATHRDDCAFLDEMRPSPDGRYLAYYAGITCGFVGKPVIHILDLRTGKNRAVTRSDGGPMHWTRASDRLFFYRQDHLNFIKIKEPEP